VVCREDDPGDGRHRIHGQSPPGKTPASMPQIGKDLRRCEREEGASAATTVRSHGKNSGIHSSPYISQPSPLKKIVILSIGNNQWGMMATHGE